MDAVPASCADLVEARMGAGLTLEDAAAMLGLHRTNLRRQETDKSRPNVAAYRLLLVLGGLVPWEQLEGWQVTREGALAPPWDPGRPYTAAILQAQHWHLQELPALRTRARELKGEVARLEGEMARLEAEAARLRAGRPLAEVIAFPLRPQQSNT